MTIKRGNVSDDQCQISIYDYDLPGYLLNASLNWTSGILTATTGTVMFCHWITPDIVTVGIASGVDATAGNDTKTFIYPHLNEGGGETAYITAWMVEELPYPTPYTPTKREAQQLTYKYRLPSVFTLMFWFRPWFRFDTDINHRLIEWYVDATHYFTLYYAIASDRICIAWRNGGATQYLASQTFTAATLNEWHQITIKIDLTTGTTVGSEIWIDGQARDAAWGAAIDAYTDDFPVLHVGVKGDLTDRADALIADLLIYPGILGGNVNKLHYLKNRPWYEPSEIANTERTVRIDRSGIRLFNTAIGILDQHGREIDISNEAGLLARDAAGQIIHDIPDAIMLKDMAYGGHLFWKEAPNYIDGYTILYTDTQATRTVESAVQNVDLSPYLPPGLTNVKGVLVAAYQGALVHCFKVITGTHATSESKYSLAYNTAPGTYNYIASLQIRNQAEDDADEELGLWKTSHALCPIAWHNGTPYLCYTVRMAFSGMKGVIDSYSASLNLFLLGVLV